MRPTFKLGRQLLIRIDGIPFVYRPSLITMSIICAEQRPQTFKIDKLRKVQVFKETVVLCFESPSSLVFSGPATLVHDGKKHHIFGKAHESEDQGNRHQLYMA